MSIQNVTPIRDPQRDQRIARAAFVDEQIRNDGRSARYVAMQTGINPTSMGDRLKGKVAFLADELEAIAQVLKVDPVDFYAGYLAADTQNSPHHDGGGDDPNVPPSDYKPVTSLSGYRAQVAARRAS